MGRGASPWAVTGAGAAAAAAAGATNVGGNTRSVAYVVLPPSQRLRALRRTTCGAATCAAAAADRACWARTRALRSWSSEKDEEDEEVE